MPRKPRFYLPGVPAHVVQRGHNREAVFFEDADYLAYLQWLSEASQKYDCSIHAYCLMTNHVHLLVSPATADGITRLMQYLGRHYVPYVNHKYGKSGSLWEGRYKASLVNAEDYLLACMRYIELNPVAADMVQTAGDYRWSSYRCNAHDETNALVRPHEIYTALGKGQDRLAAYQSIFSAHQDTLDATNDEIREASQTGTPLGNDRFQKQITKTLGQKTGQSRRGRPTGYVMSDKSKQAISRAMKTTKRRDSGTQLEVKGL